MLNNMLWFKGTTYTNVSGPELCSVLELVWDVWRREAEKKLGFLACVDSIHLFYKLLFIFGPLR